MTLLKLVFLEGQRANSFFLWHTTLHQKTQREVGFKPKTVPELGTGESPLKVHHHHLRTILTQLNDSRANMLIGRANYNPNSRLGKFPSHLSPTPNNTSSTFLAQACLWHSSIRLGSLGEDGRGYLTASKIK